MAKEIILLFLSIFFSLSAFASNIKMEVFVDDNKESLIKIKLEKGWKIYYKYPGEFGEAPNFTVNNKKISVRFPAPQRMKISGADNFVYENKISLKSKQIKIDDKVNLEYFLCNKICMAGEISSIAKRSNFPIIINDLIEKLDQQVQGSIYFHNDKLYLTFPNPLSKNLDDIIIHKDYFVTKRIKDNNEKIIVEVKYPKLRSKEWVINDLITSPVTLLLISDKEGTEVETNLSFSTKETYITFVVALFMAFLGGVILNLMPCVLPVLALKINSVTKNHVLKRIEIIFTILGIFASFFVLSNIAIFAKRFGLIFGWGIHFQNPYFTFILTLIITIFALSLFGMIRLRTPNLLNLKPTESVYVDGFASGLLTTILSTPCTAPFLGSALAFTLTASSYQIILVFMSIALGLSLPYVVLLIFPKLLKDLGKLAKYSRIINIFMAISLTLTAIWLSTVFLEQAGITKSAINNDSKDLTWEKFDESKIEAYLKQDKKVFIDITAKWCLTCYFNKINVLESKEVKEFFKINKVVLMRADITKTNPIITTYLVKHNRSGIPFNAVYSNYYKQTLNGPHIFSEILSKNELMSGIK
ncbi:MAG: thioredoxin family protein [Sphingobacteriia bacterium]|nr:thioredoxin family protein [Sphingobacteriia bacterium]